MHNDVRTYWLAQAYLQSVLIARIIWVGLISVFAFSAIGCHETLITLKSRLKALFIGWIDILRCLGLNRSFHVLTRCVLCLARGNWVREFEWSVSVDSGRSLQVDIRKSKVVAHAVRAHDLKLWVMFCLLCHVSDAKAADVIVTTGWYQHRIEVTKADGAVEFENLFLYWIVVRVVISYLHVLLVDICLDSNLIALSYLSVFDGFMDSAPLLSFLFLMIFHILYVYVVNIMIAEASFSVVAAMGVALAPELLDVTMTTHE